MLVDLSLDEVLSLSGIQLFRLSVKEVGSYYHCFFCFVFQSVKEAGMKVFILSVIQPFSQSVIQYSFSQLSKQLDSYSANHLFSQSVIQPFI